MNHITSRRKFGLIALGLATGGLAIATIASPAMAFKVNVAGGEGNEGAEGPEHEGAEDGEDGEHKTRHRRRKHKKN